MHWVRSISRYGIFAAKCWECPYRVLGGTTRNYCECYNTAGCIPDVRPGMSMKERAQLPLPRVTALPHGRPDAPANTTYNTREAQSAL